MRERDTAVDLDDSPGAALRDLRKKKGWTLARVSEATGLPVSTVSKLETGKMALTYDKITRLSRGLEIDISELFLGQSSSRDEKISSPGRRSVTSAGAGYLISAQNYDHHYLATDLLNKRFNPIIADLKARSIEEFGSLIRHQGEEFAFVLEGLVDFHTDMYAPVRLMPGDSLYFDSSMGHAYIAASEGPCRVLSVCTELGGDLDVPIGNDAPAPRRATYDFTDARHSGDVPRRRRNRGS